MKMFSPNSVVYCKCFEVSLLTHQMDKRTNKYLEWKFIGRIKNQHKYQEKYIFSDHSD